MRLFVTTEPMITLITLLKLDKRKLEKALDV